MPLTPTRSTTLEHPSISTGRRILAIGVGAVVVAVAAQVSVPLPFSPVPMTLSPLAVLLVGGVLGARNGSAALVTYIALGAIGLPVYAGGLAGPGVLLGSTGGYLLAFPLAAGAAGWIACDRGLLGAFAAATAGLVIIHIGGFAQLALLTGDPVMAWRLGTAPFLVGDGVKIVLAALGIFALGPSIRRRV